MSAGPRHSIYKDYGVELFGGSWHPTSTVAFFSSCCTDLLNKTGNYHTDPHLMTIQFRFRFVQEITFRRCGEPDRPLGMDDVAVWKERIRRAPDEELLAFRDADYLGLHSLTSERWEAVIIAAEDEMRRRALNV